MYEKTDQFSMINISYQTLKDPEMSHVNTQASILAVRITISA